ncbi:MAG: gliding motility-associated C-terminal domain-containing protein, partial [Flavobacteriales bacterium]|nr:gliding motility-associated C-terminal domain-containing protein [Flavobacteriales bacterium]
TATGMWSEDASHVQPSAVTFTDATQFDTDINNLQEGTYQLVWTVSNGTCTPATDTMVINVYDQPTADAGVDQDLCNIYTTTLAGNTPQGTATGMWSEDASHVQPSAVTFTNATQFDTDINNLQEGTYQLVWTVSNGTCTPATDTVVIRVYDQPTADAGVDQDLCNTYTTTLAGNVPQGTATGMWSEDASHVQPSAVTFTDATQFDTDINNLQEGTYQLVWTVSNGTCTPSTDTVVIRVYDQPTADAGVDQDLCNVYTTTLAGNQPLGTATGMWSEDASHVQPSAVTFTDATQFDTDINNLQEGTYQLVWTVSNGTCTPATDTVVIRVYDQPTADAGVDQDLCNIYTTTLAGNVPQGTATGMWSEDASHVQPSAVTFIDATQFDTDINNLQEGTYQLVWTVSNGTCTPATDTVVITIYDQPIADAGVDQIICEQFTTVLEGNEPQGTATGVWSIDNNYGNPTQILFYDDVDYNATASNFQEGAYQLIWTLSNGVCPTSSDTVMLSNYTIPTASFTVENRVCLEKCVTATNMSYVQSPYYITGYEWIINGINQEVTQDFEGVFCFPDTGVYAINLVVTTDRGCRDTSDVQSSITVNELPIANFSYEPEEEIMELLELQFTDESVGASSVSYDFGDGMSSDSLNPLYWYTNAGTYEVVQIVQNEEGCSDTIIKAIEVGEAEHIYIPNSFTPNGDGKNDVFYPVDRGIEAKDYNFYVFNRWGQLIYEAHQPSKGWDGLHNNKNVKTGVYVWKISYYSNVTNQTVEKMGHVNVLK